MGDTARREKRYEVLNGELGELNAGGRQYMEYGYNKLYVFCLRIAKRS